MFARKVMIICIAAVIGLTGCASQRATVPPRPLWNDIPAYRAPSDPPSAGTPAEFQEPAGDLRLRDALALALLHNPGLAGVAWDVRISEARAVQAGLRPNPELEIEVEGIGGRGPLKEFDGAETTLMLSQVVELGGDRGARKKVAIWEKHAANADYEAKRLAVLTGVTLGFIDVLEAQQLENLAQDLYKISTQTLDAVTERVNAGKVSPLEKTKASIEQANKKIELDNTQSNLRVARIRLAATWGSDKPRFVAAAGKLDPVAEIPPLAELETLIDKNPALVRWAGEMERRFAELALEKAERMFDLTFSAGVKRFEESGEYAYTVGMGLPIPIFDRNQGGAREARYRVAQTDFQSKAAQVRMMVALGESYEAMKNSRTEALALKEKIVPAAGDAFNAARSGYRQGKFTFLDVLDAQRTYAQANARSIDALARYHRAVALVQGMIGTTLDSTIEYESSQLEERP